MQWYRSDTRSASSTRNQTFPVRSPFELLGWIPTLSQRYQRRQKISCNSYFSSDYRDMPWVWNDIVIRILMAQIAIEPQVASGPGVSFKHRNPVAVSIIILSCHAI